MGTRGHHKIILNVDGSVLNNSEKTEYGGLIHKHDGSFLRGFLGSVGISNTLHVEIQALLTGRKLCWEARYRKFVCFSDSLHVVVSLYFRQATINATN